ncbi:MAG TPA: cytidine deaminase [Armatimonadota bacterium]|nr:cytidine deaminase [Armatimonadota bacterium]
MLNNETAERLVAAAAGVREYAYAPYSGFFVGAAVLGADGRVFTGCNIENISFGATVCAERVALFSAVAAGCRKIRAIAVTGPGGEPIRPCGICRQVMAELAPEATVIMQGETGPRATATVAELMPDAFAPKELTGPD